MTSDTQLILHVAGSGLLLSLALHLVDHGDIVHLRNLVFLTRCDATRVKDALAQIADGDKKPRASVCRTQYVLSE